MPTAPAAAERLPLRTKLAFGVGASAETIALYAVNSYVVLFYNQILGVPAHLVGIAISISLVLDALIEPVVGSWSDRTKSRLGRRHPWMYAAPVPIALAFFAVWNPPDGLTTLQLALWCGIAVSLMRQAMAFYHTPHLALGGELSPHYTERSKVMAYNSFFSWVGGAGMTFIALTFFFPATPKHRNGLLNPEPWPTFALVMMAAVLVVLFASAWFTRDRVPFLPKPAADTPRFSLTEFLLDLAKAFTNINYVWLLVGYFFLSMMVGLREGLRLYLYTFYWALTSEQIRWFIIGSFVGYATSFVFAARLHGRFDKKLTIMVSTLAFAIVPAIPIVLGIMGILRQDTPGLVPILIVFAGLSYCAFSILAVSVMSALADVADENELKHGIRQEGILYSTRAFAAKMDQAVGAALAGAIITLISFPEKARPGQIDHEVLQNLALWDGPLAAIPGVVAVFFYGRYRIDRAANDATKAALAARRAPDATPLARPA